MICVGVDIDGKLIYRDIGDQVVINTNDIAELKKTAGKGPKGDQGVGIKSVVIVEVTYA